MHILCHKDTDFPILWGFDSFNGPATGFITEGIQEDDIKKIKIAISSCFQKYNYIVKVNSTC